LQRSVTEMRRSVMTRPNLSASRGADLASAAVFMLEMTAETMRTTLFDAAATRQFQAVFDPVICSSLTGTGRLRA
jgi:hypothetical protein